MQHAMRAGDYDTLTVYDWNIRLTPCHANDVVCRCYGCHEGEEQGQTIHCCALCHVGVQPRVQEWQSRLRNRICNSRPGRSRSYPFGAIPPLTVSPWIVDQDLSFSLPVAVKTYQSLLLISNQRNSAYLVIRPTWYELKSCRNASTPLVLSIDNGTAIMYLPLRYPESVKKVCLIFISVHAEASRRFLCCKPGAYVGSTDIPSCV